MRWLTKTFHPSATASANSRTHCGHTSQKVGPYLNPSLETLPKVFYDGILLFLTQTECEQITLWDLSSC